ncbi:MAG: 3-deoxy-manno-octulosonate cytidylyltransferase [Bacteroidetes bacterium GWE2_41_25]|nr:MAG: 3-deoxy-manno-octulosonate cytidylyltransferase [Bacteroidetes bacterium GWA2_40_15]OFX85171.1 MAG: 3-deoxy-manno-octulosonate cytidylyltransferase [Bacteroidetes bacterium GWC2_40_22]OFX96717.1 MAG: 3-deoxy-manno-octulosonate cytidylyltransferase [Bacteroidetes bacterium GWE2_41_25]OFY60871.1 MAG: 3-deoxy-manno-octulosonate cytidylyltransferase [Bacteroidetes bacterium GWF2_41_9]HAM08970.1 3-deoxy-manno-octulosonate cytidylyltransferase [Bacteroidales bacterium]
MNARSVSRFAAIIPARYSSSRFPGKPLVRIGNKTMIQRVYEQARKSLELVYVATDDERIFNAVKGFGGKAVMTSPDHFSGTDRCAEAIDKIVAETGVQIDIVVNMQGDEPFIRPEQLVLLMNCFNSGGVELATLIREAVPGEDIFNPNQPKVIVNALGDAIYFSRSVIPFIRDADKNEWTMKHVFYKHIGLYAYRSETLQKITRLTRSPLEIAESLEQNRWIENGYRIRTAVTEWESIGIDTPEDLEKAKLILDQII